MLSKKPLVDYLHSAITGEIRSLFDLQGQTSWAPNVVTFSFGQTLKAILTAVQVEYKCANVHFNILEAMLMKVNVNLKNIIFAERNNLECSKNCF